MIQFRFESLRPELRLVLRAASILGGEVPLKGLAALLPSMDSEGLELAITEIVANEILEKKRPRDDGDRVYAFRHALLRDAAYVMLTDDDRRLGHALAGEWLDATGERDPLVLAEHFERGGLVERAIACYTDAASRALAGVDTAGALAHAERGVRCGATGMALGALRTIQAEAHGWEGRNDLAQARALAATELLPRAHPQWFIAVAWGIQASVKLADGENVERLAKDLRETLATERVEATSVLSATRGLAYLLQVTDVGQGPLFRLMERLAQTLDPRDAFTVSKIEGTRAVAAMAVGDLGETVRLAGRACDHFLEHGDLRAACPMLVGSGFAATEIGDYAEAERRLRIAIGIGEKLSLPNLLAGAKNNLGLALFRVGRIEEAIHLEQEAIAIAASVGDKRLEGIAHLYLARILLVEGRAEDAEREHGARVRA
jgi:eukaryotic-like serine/threonine-protein kinase